MNLYGIHDQEGAHLVPPDGVCVALVELSKDPSGVDYGSIRSDIHWLVRVNWGYGSTGTLPLPSMLSAYLTALQHFVLHSKDIYGIIIGNEPNHEQEWPDNQPISVDQYVQFFTLARDLVKKLAPEIKVGPAGIAPYKATNNLRWNDYLYRMLSKIGSRGGCDFVTVHAYLRSAEPGAVADQGLRMRDAPLTGQYAGFLTYEDALMAIPNEMKHLPVHITEVNDREKRAS